jgi:hypothetical protein
MPKKREAEMVGATKTGIELGDAATHASLVVPAAKAAGKGGKLAARGMAKAAAPGKMYLNIENLTSTGSPSAYDVYLNVPHGEEPRKHKNRFVGRLPMFGVAEASQPTTTHSGSGLHYIFDVTDLISRLSDEPGWNPEELRLSFVPAGKASPARVRVGRVSLYKR